MGCRLSGPRARQWQWQSGSDSGSQFGYLQGGNSRTQGPNEDLVPVLASSRNRGKQSQESGLAGPGQAVGGAVSTKQGAPTLTGFFCFLHLEVQAASVHPGLSRYCSSWPAPCSLGAPGGGLSLTAMWPLLSYLQSFWDGVGLDCKHGMSCVVHAPWHRTNSDIMAAAWGLN